ncbi:MAG: hypothetical protein ABI353_05590 [Isosphaeraceae bacterium]
MKQRLKLWMLSALVAGFALVFAGLAAASRSENRYFWFGALFGSMFGVLVSLPVLVLPWIWNRWARRRGIDQGPHAEVLERIVVFAVVLIMAGVVSILIVCGVLDWFLNRTGLLDWIVG